MPTKLVYKESPQRLISPWGFDLFYDWRSIGLQECKQVAGWFAIKTYISIDIVFPSRIRVIYCCTARIFFVCNLCEQMTNNIGAVYEYMCKIHRRVFCIIKMYVLLYFYVCFS
uniref:Uncharacterized protein n=1 Tax=Siphoviridae sp. cteEQ43 TaxID=2827905 RepID=A0A8S5TCA5_9CAUD|nr:MAG TPA: hypothetical protein [Siphoviridae sp. cteEQ43]